MNRHVCVLMVITALLPFARAEAQASGAQNAHHSAYADNAVAR